MLTYLSCCLNIAKVFAYDYWTFNQDCYQKVFVLIFIHKVNHFFTQNRPEMVLYLDQREFPNFVYHMVENNIFK